MDTKTFLTRVFAQQNEIVICTHKPDQSGQNPRGIFWNRGSFSNLDDAVAAIAQWDAEPTTTVYYTVGAFAGHSYVNEHGKQKWSRKQEQATWFKALALDLDIGEDKPYKTQKEGWAAMTAALQTIGMPMPMVVSSGRGIHCYWPMTDIIKTDHWVKASMALRIALEENNVEIDTSKIHDPSMVLRPVGTNHKKQQPWKPVQCKMDCPDYDPVALFTVLKPWFGKAAKVVAAPRKANKSSIISAVMSSNDVNIDAVGKHCKQIGTLLDTGGATDASGRKVEYGVWRLSLGMAKHCPDPQEAVIKLCGKHDKFDLNDSLNKMDDWKGTGPATCAAFERACQKGCEGCEHKGKITSPAQLSSITSSELAKEDGTIVNLQLPNGYVIKDHKIYKETVVPNDEVDGNGNKIGGERVDWDLVSNYEMHITGSYSDEQVGNAGFRLAIKYPMTGWKEKDHPNSVLAAEGKDFATFLLNRQVFVKNVAQQIKLRAYLVDYLTMVQNAAPTGLDFVSFGWQDDGSFLCGEQVINSPVGTTDRRLRGAAAHFGDIIRPEGSRDEWIAAMDMLNNPGTEVIRSAILIGTTGILGRVSGNSSMVLSIYSPETTTGKSLSLAAATSMVGAPRKLFLKQNDTENALYKIRGALNNLPCAIDELTMADSESVAKMVYALSEGRERIRLSRDADLKVPATWSGPTLVSTNISLYQKFDAIYSQNDPMRARTLELELSDRTFVNLKHEGEFVARRFYRTIERNYGWAFPELVEGLIELGGEDVMWARGEAAFNKKFAFEFSPQERFMQSVITAAWIMGTLGSAKGLFPFDVDATILYMLSNLHRTRREAVENRMDVFDTIGQFLLENSDKIVTATEVYGSYKEVPRMPAPDKAVARVKVVYDDKTPVLPGSMVAINTAILKTWLNRSNDSLPRIIKELEQNGALLNARERVTMFKGCSGYAPAQTHCVVVNLNHPRFADMLTGTSSRQQSPVLLAVLNGTGS